MITAQVPSFYTSVLFCFSFFLCLRESSSIFKSLYDLFSDVSQALHVEGPDMLTRVTEYVPEIVAFVGM